MIQFELDNALDYHRHWLRDNRFGSRADFTGRTLKNLKASHCDLTGAIFNDANVISCDFSNANLTDISGTRVHFMDTDFTNANLRNAHLPRARYTQSTFKDTDLWEVSGDGVYIISLQLGQISICYTSEVLQINCLQFDLDKIWEMLDDELREEVTRRTCGEREEWVNKMMDWWARWDDQIYQIINKFPAKPVNSPK
jgi:hypothetical protein